MKPALPYLLGLSLLAACAFYTGVPVAERASAPEPGRARERGSTSSAESAPHDGSESHERSSVRGRTVIPPGSTPRDRYEAEISALLGTDYPSVQEWQWAGRRALRERLMITPSFRERIRFTPDHPHAIGYRLALRRGQRIDLEIVQQVGGRTELFTDVFQEVDPPSSLFLTVRATDRDTRSLEFEAPADGEYIIRLQPGLRAGGTYEVTLTTSTDLIFPVKSATLKSVGSGFGAPRDGGTRDHEGIDIFAPRGTPVLAVAAGTITKVSTDNVGGRVVWQQDEERNVTYYYAHLNRQDVRVGQRVKAGSRIGTVGNTGNARRASPHLHFAIYRPGLVALNPVKFLNENAREPAAIASAPEVLGSWAAINGSAVRLRSGPSTTSDVVTELSRDARVLLIGSVSDWHRVILDDGTTGFVSMRLVGAQ